MCPRLLTYSPRARFSRLALVSRNYRNVYQTAVEPFGVACVWIVILMEWNLRLLIALVTRSEPRIVFTSTNTCTTTYIMSQVNRAQIIIREIRHQQLLRSKVCVIFIMSLVLWEFGKCCV